MFAASVTASQFGNKRIRTRYNRSNKQKQQTKNQIEQKSNHWKSDRYVTEHTLSIRTRHFMRKSFPVEIVITIIPMHIELKSPSLTICPKLYFVFCGNSVEIHVPTISLITAYRYTHIFIFVCFFFFSLSPCLFIIAFIYTQTHNPNTQIFHICIINITYFATYHSLAVQCKLIGWNECISLASIWRM